MSLSVSQSQVALNPYKPPLIPQPRQNGLITEQRTLTQNTSLATSLYFDGTPYKSTSALPLIQLHSPSGAKSGFQQYAKRTAESTLNINELQKREFMQDYKRSLLNRESRNDLMQVASTSEDTMHSRLRSKESAAKLNEVFNDKLLIKKATLTKECNTHQIEYMKKYEKQQNELFYSQPKSHNIIKKTSFDQIAQGASRNDSDGINPGRYFLPNISTIKEKKVVDLDPKIPEQTKEEDEMSAYLLELEERKNYLDKHRAKNSNKALIELVPEERLTSLIQKSPLLSKDSKSSGIIWAKKKKQRFFNHNESPEYRKIYGDVQKNMHLKRHLVELYQENKQYASLHQLEPQKAKKTLENPPHKMSPSQNGSGVLKSYLSIRHIQNQTALQNKTNSQRSVMELIKKKNQQIRDIIRGQNNKKEKFWSRSGPLEEFTKIHRRELSQSP